MAEPIVRFRGVKKAFGSKVVLRGLDIDLPRGQTSVILGPSGTGKSVFLKLLVGLMEPDEGDIEVDGVDVVGASQKDLFGLRQKIGMLFQDGALFDSMTVGENIAFPLRRHSPLSEGEIDDAVALRLEQVGLPGIEDQMPASLSGGMRKRVSLARAVVMEPEIVLFDEPNSGLDPVTSDEIDALIGRMKEELGMTFIVISHDIVGAFAVADHIAMLYNGELVIEGTPDAVLHCPLPFVRRFLARNMTLPELAP
jgi:phospholipid/cholesterol/gamma-HCH transport system ATP-binding protein